jgi:hypothetical protein
LITQESLEVVMNLLLLLFIAMFIGYLIPKRPRRI